MAINVHRARERQPTFAEQVGLNQMLGGAGAQFGKGLAEGMGYEPPEHKRAMQLEQLKGQKAQELQKLKGEQLAGKNQQELETEDRDYETVKKYFGEKAADVFRASPVGGRTRLVEQFIDAAQRGTNFEDLLETQLQPIEAKDFDQGLTPKERTKRQESRYSVNLPLYQESVQKLKSLDSEKDHLNVLEELSPQISGGIQRFNIHPQTGELILPQAATPEMQLYVKTINDFTTNAKDSYGSRVTNFDLQQFMKRLPTLANSEEGRGLILQQMKIINDINTLRERSLQNVIDEHGGIRNIDYDAAERLSEKQTKKEIGELKKQFSLLERENNKLFDNTIKKDKAIVPKGRVAVQFSDGSTGHIEQSQLKQFLEDNAGSVL